MSAPSSSLATNAIKRVASGRGVPLRTRPSTHNRRPSLSIPNARKPLINAPSMHQHDNSNHNHNNSENIYHKSRSGGRGTSLNNNHMTTTPMQRKQEQQREQREQQQISQMKPSQSNTTGNASRSEFAQSVLKNINEHRNKRRYDRSHQSSRSSSTQHRIKGMFDDAFAPNEVMNSQRLQQMKQDRAKAREQFFKNKDSINSFNFKQIDQDQQDQDQQDTNEVNPFGWGQLNVIVNDLNLPNDHWAKLYLNGVVSNLEKNSSLSNSRKRLMLQQITTSLSSISQQSSATSSTSL